MPFSSSSADDAFDYLFKIILIGDSNVGKTCVVHRFKTGQFYEKQQNTIGVDFTVRSMDIDGKKVKVGDGSGLGGASGRDCGRASITASCARLRGDPRAVSEGGCGKERGRVFSGVC